MGGTQTALTKQFMIEALLLTVISTMIGIILAIALLPSFNDLSGTQLHFSLIQFPQLSWTLTAIALAVSLIAGSYPALVLSRFKPVEVLKSKLKLGGANIFTKSLVTTQFVLSAALIISTIVILQQLHYMQSKYPGFNKDNVLVVDASGIANTGNLYALFKHELTANPEVISTASAELGLGGHEGWSQSSFKYNGKDKSVYEYFIDPDYLHTLGLHLVSGRNFDPGITSDTITAVIINESMMHDFGWTPVNALGQKLNGYYDNETDPRTPVVIGVVKDFNFRGLDTKIASQMFHQFSAYQPFKFFVRIRPGEPAKAIAVIRTAWKTIAPDYPLKYEFLDEDLDNFYRTEARWSGIVGWAGGISIFLACLGLLGLSTLAVINRTKEIGIRRVLGASIISILNLLSKDFLRLIGLALALAIPLAWYFMSKWLQDFAYRITISWWIFAATAAAMLAIALLTISLRVLPLFRLLGRSRWRDD
jgi:putative ABC transport system permease protein